MEFHLTPVLKAAPFIERMAKVELWIMAVDGNYYRPQGGWPITFVYPPYA